MKNVGEALLSPTRTYLPLLKKISSELGNELKGAVHCSGGGQTKCLKFGTKVKYVKDSMFEPPPIFSEIQRVSQTSTKEMYQVYNMGHRLEIFCDSRYEKSVLEIAKEFRIDAKVIGYTETRNDNLPTNQLDINYGEGLISYG